MNPRRIGDLFTYWKWFPHGILSDADQPESLHPVAPECHRPPRHHSSRNPKANLVILGDFNEGHPVGSDSQALDVLFQAKPPLVDALMRVKPLNAERSHAGPLASSTPRDELPALADAIG